MTIFVVSTMKTKTAAVVLEYKECFVEIVAVCDPDAATVGI